MTRPARRRFLLSCFACDPGAGSEPYVGWNWAATVYAGRARVVLTRRYHRAALEARAAEELSFRYFDLPFLSGLDHRHRLMKLYYILWQIAVLPYAAWIVRRERITDIQHVTYNAVDFPGLLWAIPGPRFLWGPAGGGQTPPPELAGFYGPFWGRQRWRARMKAALRFNPFVRLALARASLVLTANAETEARLAPLTDPAKLHRMLETAIAPSALAAAPRAPRTPFRVLWVGRFEPRKAPGLFVSVARVLSITRRGAFHFTMIGAGPMLAEIRAAASDIPDLDMTGELPFGAMRAAYAAADALAFTSLQDTSGNVVLEALAQGIPVVALDHQGSAEILPAGGGPLIPIGPPEAVTGAFAEALIRLADPEIYARTSAAALANIRAHHLWESRATRFAALIDAAPGPAPQPSAKSARAIP